MRVIFLAIIFAVLINPCLAQKNQPTKRKQSTLQTASRNIKINKKQPSIYITFDKFGKRTPLRDDESGEGIFLILHNNLRYSIRFCGFGISDKGEQLIMYGKNARTGLYYDVVPNRGITVEPPRLQKDGATIEPPKIKVPVGYPMFDLCHGVELKAGKSMVFDVPREHLAKDLSIKLGFNYECEEESEEKPTHFVHFYSSDLPK